MFDDANDCAPSTGLVVCALHASACTGGQWRDLVASLGDRATVMTPDISGYGVGGPAPQIRGLAARTATIVAMLEEAGRPVHLVGHSFGGAVALQIARARPDLVASLTVYEPAVFDVLEGGDDPADQQALREFRAMAARFRANLVCGHPADAMAGFVTFWGGIGAWAGGNAARRAKFEEQAMTVMSDFDDMEATGFSLADAARIAVPTRLIRGDRSPSVAQRTADALFAAMPNADQVVLSGQAHMAPIMDAAAVNRAIEAHIGLVGTPPVPMALAA